MGQWADQCTSCPGDQLQPSGDSILSKLWVTLNRGCVHSFWHPIKHDETEIQGEQPRRTWG